jgi:hypothetical protein
MRRATVAVVTIGVLTIASPLVHVADAKQRLGRYYGGVTAAGAPFVLELAKGGKALDSATFMVSMPPCDSGQEIAYIETLRFEPAVPAFVPSGEAVVSPQRVSRTGSFRATGVGSDAFGPGGASSVTAAIVETISGRLRPDGTASGTFRARMTLSDASGAPAGRCDSGTVKWTARSLPGRLFAGTSSDGLPFVLELDRQRKSVDRMRFGWVAPCTPEGGIVYPDELRDFRLRRGAFGDVFQPAFDMEGGGEARYGYDIKGRVASKARASGRISVRYSETDAAGSETVVCDAGTFTWSARSG